MLILEIIIFGGLFIFGIFFVGCLIQGMKIKDIFSIFTEKYVTDDEAMPKGKTMMQKGTCRFCNGTGKQIYIGRHVTCSFCDGKGFIE